LLQSFAWQEHDMAPDFPVLLRFLDFWQRKLAGRLHAVRVATSGIIGPASVKIPAALSDDRPFSARA
jgi:uncharacterized protein Usg